MGRYDLRAAQVLQAANKVIGTQKAKQHPPWYQALTNIPPSQVLFRPVQRFTDPRRSRKGKKPSKMFQPLPLTYPEDELRSTFFNDHPWELARPRVVLEDSGNDAKHWDWTRLEQPGKRVDGESVVHRQLHLINEQREARLANTSDRKLTPDEEQLATELAYDQARKEFYKIRLRQDIEREVAREEALHYGATFLPGANERALYTEDEAYEAWKAWALERTEVSRHQLATAFSESGFVDESEDGETEAILPEPAFGEEFEEERRTV